MGIEWRNSAHGKKVLHVVGPFGFSCHKEFMGQIKQHAADAEGQHFDVDLSGVTSLDSAALGMLLILHDWQQAKGKPVALRNCSKAAKENLYLANLHKHFSID